MWPGLILREIVIVEVVVKKIAVYNQFCVDGRVNELGHLQNNDAK